MNKGTTYELKFNKFKYLWKSYDGKVDPWVPLLLGVLIGAPLYGLKRMHIIRTDLLILLFIFLPLAIFYMCMAISGETMQELRDASWFLSTSYGCDGGASGPAPGPASAPAPAPAARRLLGPAKSDGPYCAFERVNFWDPVEVVCSFTLIATWILTLAISLIPSHLLTCVAGRLRLRQLDCLEGPASMHRHLADGRMHHGT